MSDLFLNIHVRAIDSYSGVLKALVGDLGGARLAAVEAGAALAGIAVAGLVKVTSDAIKFQNTMQQIANNTTMGTQGLKAMSAEVLKLHAINNVPVEDLARGFMHITNYGYSAADATRILEAAFKSAVSTGSKVEGVAEALSNVMHEFSIPVKNAAKAMDVLHLAAAQGNMTLEQFTGQTGKALGMAANAHVPLVQVAAALSALTRHGESAAIASTNLSGMISKIINPSKAAQKELATLSQQTGINLVADFSSAGLKSKGLTGVLHDLMLATHGNVSEIFKLIPAMRGGQGAMILTGTGAKDYRDILASLNAVMAGKLHPTQAAYNAISQTTAFRLDHLKGMASTLSIELGQKLLPYVNKGIALFTDIATKIVQWAQSHQQLIVKVVEVGGKLAALVGGVLAVIRVIGLMRAALQLLVGSTGIGLVLLAVVALYEAWTHNWFGIRDKLSAVWNGTIKPILAGFGPGFQQFIHNPLGALNAFWTTIWTRIKEPVTAVWNVIKVVVSDAMRALADTIKLAMDLIRGNFKGAWNDIKDFFASELDAIKVLAVNGWNLIKAHGMQILQAMVNGLIAIMTFLPTRILGLMNAMKGDVVSVLQGLANDALSLGGNIIKNLAQGVTNAAGAVVGAVKNVVGAVANLLPHSPAKEGPLAEMPSFLHLADAINAAQPAVRTAMANLANTISNGLGSGGVVATGAGGGGGGTLNLNVTVSGSSASNQAIASAVAQQVMRSLRSQGTLRPQLG